MFIIAVRADEVFEQLPKPAEYLNVLEKNAASGPRVEMTRDFLHATFFETVLQARDGARMVLGEIPTTNSRGRAWPEGFLIRSSLHVSFDSPRRTGEVAILPVLVRDNRVTLGSAVEIAYVEAVLSETNPVKASKIGGVFQFTYTGNKSTFSPLLVPPQMDLFQQPQ